MNNPPDREKPLGHKAYGSIAHLPGSRRGPADKGLSESQASICTSKARDKNDLITVQEKLDGSNVAVAKINGVIIPLGRSGHVAVSSKYEQHRHFHNWVYDNHSRFDLMLSEGERCVGEWLMQAHGTIYDLPHEPFVIFDIMNGYQRQPAAVVASRAHRRGFVSPRTIHVGGPISIESALKILDPSGHGAIGGAEGAVWRVERGGAVDFLGKFVRHDKIDGVYLPEISGKPPVWNWRPPV